MALKTHECSVGSSFITLMVMQQIILLSVHLVFMTGQCTFAKPASNKTGVVHVNVTCRCVRVTLCRGQAINIKYSEYVSLALVAQHAKCMRLILSCGMCVSTIFFNIISYVTHSCKKKVIEHQICVFIFYETFARNISHFPKNRARYTQVFM